MEREMMPGQPAIPGQGPPLLNWYDLDPQKWRVFCATCDITLGVDAGEVGAGSIQLLNHPQYVYKMSYQFLGNTGDPESSGLINDGQVLCEWSDQRTNYTISPVSLANLWGPMINGQFPELGLPLYYQGVNVMSFRLTNIFNRILTPESDDFTVQIAAHGIANLTMGGVL